MGYYLYAIYDADGDNNDRVNACNSLLVPYNNNNNNNIILLFITCAPRRPCRGHCTAETMGFRCSFEYNIITTSSVVAMTAADSKEVKKKWPRLCVSVIIRVCIVILYLYSFVFPKTGLRNFTWAATAPY